MTRRNAPSPAGDATAIAALAAAAKIAGRALIYAGTGPAGRRRSKGLGRITDTTATYERQPQYGSVNDLRELIYELLDAHVDTAQLAEPLTHDSCWMAHVQYLQALQRKGRELLARAAADLSA